MLSVFCFSEVKTDQCAYMENNVHIHIHMYMYSTLTINKHKKESRNRKQTFIICTIAMHYGK